jgi:hypothetical protein
MTVPRPNRFIVAYLGLTAAAGAVAAGLGLVLAWDGSWLAFNALDRGRPAVFFARWIEIPLQVPVVVARRLTEDVGLLSVVYGLSFFAVPVIALAASWWLVRAREPRLFAWAALGVGLIALAGQAFAVSEGMMAVQVTWPLFLAVLAGSLSERRVVVATLGIALAVTAPTAVPLLLGLAAATAIVQLLDPDRPRRDAWWILVFLALAAAAGVRSVVSDDIAAHAVELTLDVIVFRFRAGLLGLPLAAALTTYLAGALLVAGSVARRGGRADVARRLDRLAVVAAVVAGAILVVWALDTHAWATAFNYRTWLPFLSVPLFGLAFLDAHLLRRETGQLPADTLRDDDSARRWLALSQAASMFLVLTLIGLSWRDLTQRLDGAIAVQPAGCIEQSKVGWIRGTALDHWSLTAESVLLGGRQPLHIILPSCAVDFSKGVRVTSWSLRRYSGGWFRLSELRSALVASP